jgi:hypothetical protein
LSEVGFVEGRNIAIEYRWAENQYDRLPALGAGSSSPSGGGDCHARGNAASLAAKPVTTTTPVVYYGSADPVEAGLVASLNRPGGKVTGVVTLNIDTGQKRLELGSTTARSGDEVALIAETISHYPPVLIASLSNNSSRRRPRKKRSQAVSYGRHARSRIMDPAPIRVAAEMRFAQRLSAPLTIRRGRLRGWGGETRTRISVADVCSAIVTRSSSAS